MDNGSPLSRPTNALRATCRGGAASRRIHSRPWHGAAALVVVALWMGACAGGRAPQHSAAAVDPEAQLLAELDTTLALAIAQGQLAALQANDPALRMFAARSVARYAALRGRVRIVAERLGEGPLPTVVVLDDSLQASAAALDTLRARQGARFDLLYVQHARLVHRELLQTLNAAVRLVHDRELREALQRAGMAWAAPAGTPHVTAV